MEVQEFLSKFAPVVFLFVVVYVVLAYDFVRDWWFGRKETALLCPACRRVLVREVTPRGKRRVLMLRRGARFDATAGRFVRVTCRCGKETGFWR